MPFIEPPDTRRARDRLVEWLLAAAAILLIVALLGGIALWLFGLPGLPI